MDTPHASIRFVARIGLVLVCLAVVAACRAPAANAQGVVSGHVLDAENAAPLADVAVRALNQAGETRLLVLTDSAGFFLLTLPRGRYTLVAERIGYGVLSTSDVQVRNEAVLDVVLKLGVEPILSAPLVVRSRARLPVATETFRRRMEFWSKTGQGRFITRDDIAATAVLSVNDLLNRDRDISIVKAEVGDVPLFVRRGSACSPALYLNGFPLQTPGGGAFTDVSTMFGPDDLEGVEIYPSEIHMPAELWRPNHNCGAIAFWTRVNRGNPFSMRRIGIAAGFLAAGLLVLAQ